LRDCVEYEPYIEHLKNLFGDVYVYKYGDFRKNSGRVIKEMYDFIGIEMPEIDKDAYNRRWNVGYTEREIEISRRANRIFKTKLNRNGIISLHYNTINASAPYNISKGSVPLRLKKRGYNKLLPVYKKKAGKMRGK